MPCRKQRRANALRGVWLAAFFVISVAQARIIGPDSFGYIGTDEFTFSWDEIAPGKGGPGIEIAALTSQDDLYASIPIGFGFRFYGTRYTSVYVSINGLLAFGSNGLPDSFTTAPIPTPSPPNNLVAPFWDDLTLWPTQKIYYAVLGAEPYRRLVVQYAGAAHFNDQDARYHFQVILYETWNQVRMQYLDMINGPSRFFGDGRNATLGIEDAAGTNGLQWSRNEMHSVSNGMCLVFYPPVAADLVITKQAFPSPVFLHSELTYVLMVSNIGPDAATAVQMQDTLPAGVVFTEVTTSQGGGAYSNGVVVCNLGALEEHATAVVTIRVQIADSGVLTNTATVAALQTDPDLSNNSVTQIVEVISQAHLTIEGYPENYGESAPYAYGIHIVDVNLSLTNRVNSPVFPVPGTRHRCTGWSGPGLDPPAGTDTQAVFVATTSATQTWLWTTEHYLSITATNGIIRGAEEGWLPDEFIYDLVPTSAPNFYFMHWITNGIPAGSDVPLKMVMDSPKEVGALFTPAFNNMTGFLELIFISWRRINLRIYAATLRICNPNTSDRGFSRPFWFAVAPSTRYYLVNPDGTNALDGRPYVDITTKVENALAMAGNQDLVLDPGECVDIADIRIRFTGSIVPVTGIVYAAWANPPAIEFDELMADTDGDGFTNLEEMLAGTNPHDPACYLHVVGTEWINGKLRLTWQGGTGVVQHVMAADQLEGPAPWSAIMTNTPPMSRTNVMDFEPDNSPRFFRITVP